MHIFFSGIGGTAIGPLALIAIEAGYEVSGSDKQTSSYIEYLRTRGIDDIQVGQDGSQISLTHKRNSIDWVVYSSAVAIENPNHPEIVFAKENNIRLTKRDELLNKIIEDKGQKLIALAGTHGKTTTTAMVIWLMKQFEVPVSYSVGAKISFGEMGHFNEKSEYFIYECDEYDRNFLAFKPYLNGITGIAYDHHDIFPTESSYLQAFSDFVHQSELVVGWQDDVSKLSYQENTLSLSPTDPKIEQITLAGKVNRLDGWLAVQIVHKLTNKPIGQIIENINKFPGVSRRFEKIASGLYSDYAHTPEKIAGCLQLAREISSNVVVVYEPLTNKRQYEIKDSYNQLFEGVKKLYWVPSYLTREDPTQIVLTPNDLIACMANKEIAKAQELNDDLRIHIQKHLSENDLVLCISGGGGGSLDEWLRRNF